MKLVIAMIFIAKFDFQGGKDKKGENVTANKNCKFIVTI